ncbi:MAG: HflK protein [Spirochaetes bacterium GWF1_31_7]|nr:MAG: HflK protein [Spirochaetes bacterium GWE1_32_154]OHD46923.1 MAG: HflK protein [Spirochaetes bacterium GWF1_31_7]OHD48701.1 MAG: HflK protein [Spirochaetes bacterium GWE2_31_10]OHD77050.1 MAG: HflK protein [Spirochaetes bacterium RIFOXYB1_FULL_32_8]HBD94930.1 FtsH protease activity modulator HflK [Spirochaetia bacterium]
MCMKEFKLPNGFIVKPVLAIALAIGLLGAIGVFMTFFIVDQKEQGVILRFGKLNRLVDPGLNFKLPFGIEKSYLVPTQVVLKEEFGFRTLSSGNGSTQYSQNDFPNESSMLTGDLNIVNVEWIIQYRISDPVQWLFNVDNPIQTIRDISQSVVNQLIGDRAILDVIGAERANIEVHGQDMMNVLFEKYELGIRVTTLKLQNIVPPKGTVQNAFEDVNKAIQDRNRLINEGKQVYNEQVPKAKGESEAFIQEAKGYAIERTNKAEGDVARFINVLSEYKKNPEVTRTRLYFEMYENVFVKDEKIDLIDKNLKNFVPFKTLNDQTAGGSK